MTEIDTGGAVPVTVLTGFLGAGKTTLLNRLLSGGHGLRVGVLVNDFGAINVDEQLVVGVEESAISLANGCVCCELSEDLAESVEQLIGRAEQPDYIVLEASGVADPAGIALTLANPGFRDRIRLDGVVSIIDSEQLFANSDYPGLQELKLRQIAASDMVVINKIDLVDASELDRIDAWIDDRIPRVRRYRTSYAAVPYEILLGVGTFHATRLTAHDHLHADANGSFSTWSYETEHPLSLEALRKTVKALPASVFRCKGIVYSQEEPERRVILQAVGRRSDLSTTDEWAGRPRRTQIVVIGPADGLDVAQLQDSFAACSRRTAYGNPSGAGAR